MNMEIFKTSPEDLFFKIKLDNGKWIVYRAEEITDDRRIFTIKTDIKIDEFARWLLINMHNTDPLEIED